MKFHFLFSTTNMVFIAEDELKEIGIECEIVPTPVTNKVCCGVCVSVKVEDKDRTKNILEENYIEIAGIIG